MEDGLLMRKCYREDGTVTLHQVKLPKHLVPKFAIQASRQIKQTPQNQEDDTRRQNNVLLPAISTENQSLGNKLSRLHRQQENGHEIISHKAADQYRIHHGTR